jgi:predicted DCC family thiol-disulfide oxidoreductase YuxK
MIVYYDGVCALCNRFVRWALRRDRRRRLLFASLDGESATRLRRAFPETRDVDSIVVRDADRVFVKSNAILAIAHELGGIWRLSAVLRLIPRPLRDWGYDQIAARRYERFGRLESCPLPAPDERDRFLDLSL